MGTSDGKLFSTSHSDYITSKYKSLQMEAPGAQMDTKKYLRIFDSTVTGKGVFIDIEAAERYADLREAQKGAYVPLLWEECIQLVYAHAAQYDVYPDVRTRVWQLHRPSGQCCTVLLTHIIDKSSQ